MTIFNFFTCKLKKKYWMVTEICLLFSSIQWTECSLKGHKTWLKTEFLWTIYKYSVVSCLKGEFSSCANDDTFGYY